MKRIVDLTKKAKAIIDLKNAKIEELEKERARVKVGEEEEQGVSHKRKKPEET